MSKPIDEAIRLSTYSRFSGCGAKLGPALLDKALCGLSQKEDPRLISGFQHAEDAGVYQIGENSAIVQTVDFFPPIVDDPFLFGRIAAANALSDLFAMGADPMSALTILCFPKDDIDISHLRTMMEGALSALSEASCTLLGGHSVDDRELKLGFSVNGSLSIDKMWSNNTPRPGDRLVLTKALGTGLINTAMRAEMVDSEALKASEQQMATLNLQAMHILKGVSVSACTDVTGFGLLGHAAEICSGSGCKLSIDAEEIPLLPKALDYARMGLVPEGTGRNRSYRLPFVRNARDLDPISLDVLFDPQTSGGLLAAVSPSDANKCLEALKDAGMPAAIIGTVEDGNESIQIKGAIA